MKILLQHKIFVGYFLLMAIIGSMVAIVLHERNRVRKIEDESIAIFQTQYRPSLYNYVTNLWRIRYRVEQRGLIVLSGTSYTNGFPVANPEYTMQGFHTSRSDRLPPHIAGY